MKRLANGCMGCPRCELALIPPAPVEVKKQPTQQELDRAASLARLTGAEAKIARLACRGMSNRQVGERLGLVEGTVKNTLHHVYIKLGVRTRTQLALLLIGSEFAGTSEAKA